LTKSLSHITRYALFALLIFTPLARGSVQEWAIAVIHIITLIALTAFLFEKSLTWSWEWIETPLDKPVAVLMVLTALSTIFSVHQYTSFWSLILLLNYLTIFYLTIHTVRTRSQFRQVVYLIIGTAIFLSVFCFFKKSGTNPFPWWDYSDIGLNREIALSSSTYGNPNHFAGFLAMTIPIALMLFFTGVRGIALFLLFCLNIILLAALVLSTSRGGWMSTFIGICFMAPILLATFQFRQKKFLYIFIAGFIILSLVFLSSRTAVMEIRTITGIKEDASILSRALIWKSVSEMIMDYPLLGAGPGTFALIFTQYQPVGGPIPVRYYFAHNDYLQYIAEMGLPFSLVLLWIIFSFYRAGLIKLRHNSRLVRGITLGGLSAVTAILAFSLVDFNLHIPANAILFSVISALVVAPIPAENTQLTGDHPSTI